jgi:hypothetical protein
LPDGDGDPFRLRERFDERFGLENNYPNGAYQIVVRTVHDGERTVAFSLGGDAYPPAPILNDYGAAQRLAADAYNEISWLPFAGGTAADFVQVQIEDPLGANVWETPDYGEPGALNGLATRVLLPARSLRPGTVYIGTLRFVKVAPDGTGEYPGVKRMAGYFRRTEFRMGTLAAGVAPAIDRLELWKIRRTEQWSEGAPFPQARPWEFAAETDAVASNQIASVQLVLPDLTAKILAANTNLTRFDFADDSPVSESALHLAYPDGLYQFEAARQGGGVERVAIRFPSGAFPPAPNLQGLLALSVRRAGENLFLGWEPWVGAAEGDFIRVDLLDESGKIWDTASYGSPRHLRADATEVTIPALAFKPGHAYRVRVHFFRVDFRDLQASPGGLAFGGRAARTEFAFATLPPDVPQFRVAEGQYFWQRGDTRVEADAGGGYRFEASASGAASNSLRAVQISVPDRGDAALAPDPSGAGFRLAAADDSAASLAGRYPAGPYTFRFDTANDGMRTSAVTLATTDLPPLPHVRNFSTLAFRPATATFDITWLKWENADTNTDSVRFTLANSVGAVILDSGDVGAERQLAVTSTNMTVPSGTLRANQSYLARLRFERRANFEGAAYPGARGTASVFSEAAFYVSTLDRLRPFLAAGAVLNSAGDLQFRLTNPLRGRTYALYATGDFQDWTLVGTQTVVGTALFFTNTPSSDRAFFRALLLP